jgi:anti-sigma-K factor RskA
VNAAACNDCRNLLGGYVLHALEPDEADEVRRHLASCEACAAEHEQLTGIPALLDTAGSVESVTEQPPAALEEAVLDRFAREHQTRPQEPADQRSERPRRAGIRSTLRGRFARPLPAALAGALAAAAVTAALIVLPGGSGDNHGGEQYQASLFGSSAAPGARASAKLQVFATGTHVRLSVRGLRGSPDAVYELWCLRDDGAKVSAGTFRTDGSGRADVSLTTAAIPGEYHRLGVERRRLTPAGQAGTSVMAGEIQYPHS